MSKEREEYRLRMLRQLEHVNRGPPPAEVLEAEKVIARYRQKQAEARAAIPRVSAPIPDDGLCPECWFQHGLRSTLIALQAPDPSKYDRMTCRTCGFVDDRLISDLWR